MKVAKTEEDIRMREQLGSHGAYRKGNPSPKGKVRQVTSKSKYMGIECSELEREKAMEAEVYKENYQKLKQKYLKEAETSKSEMSKRVMLESN